MPRDRKVSGTLYENQKYLEQAGETDCSPAFFVEASERATCLLVFQLRHGDHTIQLCQHLLLTELSADIALHAGL